MGFWVDFGLWLVDYSPDGAVALIMVISLIQWIRRLGKTEPDNIDKGLYGLWLMNVCRTVFFEWLKPSDESLRNGDTESNARRISTAQTAALILALCVMVLVWLLFALGKAGVDDATVLGGLVLTFAILHGQSPWPQWLNISLIVLLCFYLCMRKHVHTGVFVLLTSVWYTMNLVYGTSYFVELATDGHSDSTAMYDLVHDATFGTTACLRSGACMARIGSITVLVVVRLALCVCAAGRDAQSDWNQRKADVAAISEELRHEANTAAAEAKAAQATAARTAVRSG